MNSSVGIVKTEYAQFDVELQLESGRLLGPLTLAYETYGSLNRDRSNVILVTHAWTGDAHAAGKNSPEDPKPGWWDDMIGPGKVLDTDRYFVLCSNTIGSCKGSTGPTSINPRTGKAYNLSFPVVMVRDMVRAQKLLIDQLGISSLVTVIGGSMGAMQAIEWGLLYPDLVRSIIPIAGSGRTSPMAIALNALARQAIYTDRFLRSVRGGALPRLQRHQLYQALRHQLLPLPGQGARSVRPFLELRQHGGRPGADALSFPLVCFQLRLALCPLANRRSRQHPTQAGQTSELSSDRVRLRSRLFFG
ncbi:MAG: alpha/beta hydrolase [Desulfuromonadaceae bacterium]